MPRWKEHYFIESVLLGRVHPEVHFSLDFLNHHRGITHNELGLLLSYLAFGYEGLLAAYLHMQADWLKEKVKFFRRKMKDYFQDLVNFGLI
jgi:hypothetical protein